MSYIDSLFSLTGKTAVVIGGTGELCGAMAEGLAGAGAEVVLVGRSSEKAARRLEQINQNGLASAWFLECDLTCPENCKQLLDQVIERSGKVDILINGAGVNSATPFAEISDDELDSIIRVNFKSVVWACQQFGSHMVQRGEGGSIINVGSLSGVIPLSRVFTYSATKAAVHNLTKNLAREWAPFKVRVNTLVPGFFPAEQNKKVLTPDRVAQIMNHTPMKRFGSSHELIGAALLLASDAGGFITGSELVVDGGFLSTTI